MLWSTPKNGCGTAVDWHATIATSSWQGSLRQVRKRHVTPMLAGTGRGDFLAALEDRVKAEECAPLLQLHFPDLLDDYLNKVLVETGQRFFKKEPMDAPDYADMAARRRELLPHRLEARKTSANRKQC